MFPLILSRVIGLTLIIWVFIILSFFYNLWRSKTNPEYIIDARIDFTVSFFWLLLMGLNIAISAIACYIFEIEITW